MFGDPLLSQELDHGSIKHVLESISRPCSRDLPIVIHPISPSGGRVRLATGCTVLGVKTQASEEGVTRPLWSP